jgi:hypothetical protein
MRRFTRSLLLAAAILAVVCLATGCGAAQSAVSSLASRASATSSHGATTPSSDPTTTPSPAVTTVTATATPTPTPTPTTPSPAVTTVTATATPTVRPSVTVTRPAASPSATVSSSPAASSSEATKLLWLWILLGALVVIGVIVLIARSVGHRSAAAASWRSRVIDAYAKGSALNDAMAVAETPGALAAADASARWYDIQRRADDFAQTLYALREAAPNEDERARVENVLGSLQAARSAMDAERAPGGAGPQHAEIVRSRLMSFEASLRTLRGSDQPPF